MGKYFKRTGLKGIAACALVCAMILTTVTPVQAAVTPKKVAAKIRSAVSSYPFSDSDAVLARRRRGKKTIFSADAGQLSSFVAYQKTKSDAEYILFVGKAKSKSKAKSVKKALKTYVRNEASGMKNYLSADANRSFEKAKIGSDGKWVWAVVLASSSDNEKAQKVIKKKI